MASTKKDPVLVILQLSGANDYMNTIILIATLCTMTTGRRSTFRKTRSCP